MINVYLDDQITPLDEDNWTIVRTYKSCVQFLEKHRDKINLISLDHDLGERKTGYDVACFMIEKNIIPPVINIHSLNPVGVLNIEQLLRKHIADNKIKSQLTRKIIKGKLGHEIQPQKKPYR
jgi:hypothetical protein